MFARFRYRLSIRIALFAVGILLLTLFAMSRPPRKPDFLDATRAASYSNLASIATQLVGDLHKTNHAEFVTRNKATLEAARPAIDRPIERPEASYRHFDYKQSFAMKKLGSAMVAEGQIAEGQMRYREATKFYIDAIRLGERVEHGPMYDYLVGAGIERYALKSLEAVPPKLSDGDLVELSARLQSFNESRITWNEILAREHYFMALNATNVVEALKDRFSQRTREMIETMRESQFTLRAQIEIAATTMAAICYARENSAPLTNVETLAPKYLPKVPIDPFSNRPLLVLTTTNRASIYSVGPNKRDDHGTSDDIVAGHRDSTWINVITGALSSQ